MAVMSRQEMHMYRLYTTYHSVFLVIATMKCIHGKLILPDNV